MKQLFYFCISKSDGLSPREANIYQVQYRFQSLGSIGWSRGEQSMQSEHGKREERREKMVGGARWDTSREGGIQTCRKGLRKAQDPLMSVGDILAYPPSIPSTVGSMFSQYFLASP